MIDSKVLIFISPIYSLKSSDGGPSGFISQNLIGHSAKHYVLSNDLLSSSGKGSLKRWRRKINSMRQAWKKEKLDDVGELFKYWIQASQKHFIDVEGYRYKFIYFHDVWTLSSCLPLIGDKQIIILQSHCPELPSAEASADPFLSKADIIWREESEKAAFTRANILVFPNKYSQEIYTSLIRNNHKIYYVMSGAKQPPDLRNYPLGQEIYLLYIGRRNYVKGFDIILNGFRKAFKERQDIRLVLAGKGTEVVGDGIFDIGFTDCIHQWIYNSDYVINCNRQSYFDLSVMETLSIGTPIIIANTNGHYEFSEDESSGIISIGEPNEEVLYETLLSESLVKKQKNQTMIQANQLLYKDKYSDSLYRFRFEGFAKEVLDKN